MCCLAVWRGLVGRPDGVAGARRARQERRQGRAHPYHKGYLSRPRFKGYTWT